MKHEPFHAIADVWAVPRPRSSKYYLKDWGKPLFSCIISVDPSEGQTELLRVKLENRKDRSLLAVAPYDGQHGITSVADSARHYVLIVRNPSAEAWLGIGFRDPADSIDFSLAIQTFMRRRMFENRLSSPGWATRRTANMAAKKHEKLPGKSSAAAVLAQGDKHTPASGAAGDVPLISPPLTDSASSSDMSSEEEFGEFH